MLADRVALVTGASSGIGRGVALALAAGVAEEVRAMGRRALLAQADVSDAGEVDRMVAAALDAFGRIDILVNNAGIAIAGAAHEMPVDLWDRVIAVHLRGTFLVTRAVLPHMYARGRGRIINTASAHSLVASPFKAAYVTAKHGVAGLNKTVALELATFGVTSNCISPGYVWTPLVEKQIPDTMAARHLTRDQVINDVLLTAQPTKQFVTTDQVAALAVFLCSDAASQITGANISMDGGWTAA